MDRTQNINTGMVLAAGLGTRMRPITDNIPKPLVSVAGKTLLDRALDALAAGGVKRAFLNVHYLADQIEQHVDARSLPEILISDERSELLDSGGGVKKAIADEPDGPLIILNGDSFWIDEDSSNIQRMKSLWDPEAMDMLLLVAAKNQAVGYDGAGDFFIDDRQILARRNDAETAPYIYAGAIITRIGNIRSVSDTKFSLNHLFDKAIQRNRLYGCRLDGLWLHVGTPASIEEAELAIDRHAANSGPNSDIKDT
ncbi:MAG: NTP transferase domain-containing protein [Rhizobiaceae bacterium]|nr:NTP transferase domain-containing protein [Rhizobiaceae bacterium]